MYEIERKFLVTKPLIEIGRAEFKKKNHLSFQMIEQCYLGDTGEWAIRGRTTVNNNDELTRQYFLTMKRKQTKRTCIELEDHTSAEMYARIKATCGHRPIVKKRWFGLPSGFTIDEFQNPELNGLVMAEIELRSEDEDFPRPEWLGHEVTGVKGFGNSFMVKKLR